MSVFDILGNAFAVVILNEFGYFTSYFFHTSMEVFHPQQIKEDGYYSIKTKQNIVITCFISVMAFTFLTLINNIFFYYIYDENNKEALPNALILSEYLTRVM